MNFSFSLLGSLSSNRGLNESSSASATNSNTSSEQSSFLFQPSLRLFFQDYSRFAERVRKHEIQLSSELVLSILNATDWECDELDFYCLCLEFHIPLGSISSENLLEKPKYVWDILCELMVKFNDDNDQASYQKASVILVKVIALNIDTVSFSERDFYYHAAFVFCDVELVKKFLTLGLDPFFSNKREELSTFFDKNHLCMDHHAAILQEHLTRALKNLDLINLKLVFSLMSSQTEGLVLKLISNWIFDLYCQEKIERIQYFFTMDILLLIDRLGFVFEYDFFLEYFDFEPEAEELSFHPITLYLLTYTQCRIRFPKSELIQTYRNDFIKMLRSQLQKFRMEEFEFYFEELFQPFSFLIKPELSVDLELISLFAELCQFHPLYANISNLTHFNNNPICLAIKQKYWDVFKILFQAYPALLLLPDQTGVTPLYFLCKDSDSDSEEARHFVFNCFENHEFSFMLNEGFIKLLIKEMSVAEYGEKESEFFFIAKLLVSFETGKKILKDNLGSYIYTLSFSLFQMYFEILSSGLFIAQERETFRFDVLQKSVALVRMDIFHAYLFSIEELHHLRVDGMSFSDWCSAQQKLFVFKYLLSRNESWETFLYPCFLKISSPSFLFRVVKLIVAHNMRQEVPIFSQQDGEFWFSSHPLLHSELDEVKQEVSQLKKQFCTWLVNHSFLEQDVSAVQKFIQWSEGENWEAALQEQQSLFEPIYRSYPAISSFIFRGIMFQDADFISEKLGIPFRDITCSVLSKQIYSPRFWKGAISSSEYGIALDNIASIPSEEICNAFLSCLLPLCKSSPDFCEGLSLLTNSVLNCIRFHVPHSFHSKLVMALEHASSFEIADSTGNLEQDLELIGLNIQDLKGFLQCALVDIELGIYKYLSKRSKTYFKSEQYGGKQFKRTFSVCKQKSKLNSYSFLIHGLPTKGLVHDHRGAYKDVKTDAFYLQYDLENNVIRFSLAVEAKGILDASYRTGVKESDSKLKEQITSYIHKILIKDGYVRFWKHSYFCYVMPFKGHPIREIRHLPFAMQNKLFIDSFLEIKEKNNGISFDYKSKNILLSVLKNKINRIDTETSVFSYYCSFESFRNPQDPENAVMLTMFNHILAMLDVQFAPFKLFDHTVFTKSRGAFSLTKQGCQHIIQQEKEKAKLYFDDLENNIDNYFYLNNNYNKEILRSLQIMKSAFFNIIDKKISAEEYLQDYLLMLPQTEIFTCKD